jgi:hypothetical protein
MNDLSVCVNNDYSIVEPLMPLEKELAVILNLNLDYPVKVDLTKEYTNNYLNSLKVKSKRGRPKASKNKDKIEVSGTNNNLNYDKPKLGHPKGSKNRPKL